MLIMKKKFNFNYGTRQLFNLFFKLFILQKNYFHFKSNSCGQERFRSIAKSYFRRADGVVLMYDVTCEQSFLNVREWIQTITDITDRTIPIIIIGNKTDLRDSYAKNGTRVIDYQEGLKFAKVRKIYFLN